MGYSLESPLSCEVRTCSVVLYLTDGTLSVFQSDASYVYGIVRGPFVAENIVWGLKTLMANAARAQIIKITYPVK